jgi:hypothetical protein
MKKAKHSEEKIIGAVKQLEAGRPVKEVAREMGGTSLCSADQKPQPHKFGAPPLAHAHASE